MTIIALEKRIKKIFEKKFGEDTNMFSFSLPPPHLNFDLSSNFALIVAKKHKRNINDVFNDVKDLLKELKIDVELVNGFLNFRLPENIYQEYINLIISNETPFVKDENKKFKVIIEFVSANPTGPLHLASGVGASLGDSLARIMKECGFNVFTEYYVNDCGRQVELLGKSLMARYLGEEVGEDGYHGEYLFEIARKLPPEAKNWVEEDDIESFSRFAINEIITQQKKDLESFGVVFDNWFYESELHKNMLPDKILKILEEKNAVEIKEAAKWLKMEGTDDKERVLVKSNGAKTYFLNDLAYHWTKYERGFNWIIDIWGADHHGYIPRMKTGLKLMGFDERTFTVIIHQLVSIKRGNEVLKMSKRAGNFHTLRDLITETSKDAVRFFFTMRSPNTHLVFDVDLAKKQSNENPLYYVSYAHARCFSIIENANKLGIELNNGYILGEYNLTEDDRKILRKIFWFEKILFQCIKELTPHHITLYLIELAKEFHYYYERNRVIVPQDLKTTTARLFIISGVKEIIRKGLSLIGVSAPCKM